MRTQTTKKHVPILQLFMVLGVALSLLFAPLGTSPAYAKTLKQAGVRFAKAGQVVKSKQWYWGAGLQDCACSVKSVKIKNAKKAGYKTATVVIEFRENWRPTNSQIIAMADHGTEDWLDCGNIYPFVVDGKTGDNLDAKRVAKKYGITVKRGSWKSFKRKTFYASDGSWIYYHEIGRIKYTITYPKSYKDLCVGIGAGRKKFNEGAMRKFNSGHVTYPKCWWHKNNKSGTHFVRVR